MLIACLFKTCKHSLENRQDYATTMLETAQAMSAHRVARAKEHLRAVATLYADMLKSHIERRHDLLDKQYNDIVQHEDKFLAESRKMIQEHERRGARLVEAVLRLVLDTECCTKIAEFVYHAEEMPFCPAEVVATCVGGFINAD